MGTSKSQPSDWMTKDGTGKITTFADERGWCIKHANGQVEVLHAMKDILETPAVAPYVVKVTNPDPGEYSIAAGDVLEFIVEFSEPVLIAGGPFNVIFDENGAQVGAMYWPGVSVPSTDNMTFSVTWDVGAVGDVDNVVENLVAMGNIVGADDGVTAALLDFPDDYAQPTGITVVA